MCDCIAHSWHTIEHGINDTFYLHVSNDNTNINLRPNDNYAIILDQKQYNGAELALELSTKMTNVLTGTAYARGMTATYSASTQQITIVTTYNDMTFKILTANDIETKLNGSWVGDAYDEYDPCDINSEMLKLTSGNASYNSFTNPFVSSYVNLQPIRNLYVHSSNIGSYSTIGLNGCRTIIKKYQ